MSEKAPRFDEMGDIKFSRIRPDEGPVPNLRDAEAHFTEKPQPEKIEKKPKKKSRFAYDPERRKAVIAGGVALGTLAVGGVAAASGILKEKPEDSPDKQGEDAVKAMEKRDQDVRAAKALGGEPIIPDVKDQKTDGSVEKLANPE